MNPESRALALMKLLDDMPGGVCLVKTGPVGTWPSIAGESFDVTADGFRAWVAEARATGGGGAALSDEEFEKRWGIRPPTDAELREEESLPEDGVTWVVSWESDNVDAEQELLAESADLVKALLVAKNRLRAMGVVSG